MRKNQIKGIINDFLDFNKEHSPLNHISINYKLELDLKSNKFNISHEDDVVRFYRNKSKWLLNRIDKLKGDIRDFEIIKIIALKRKEKLIIVYEGEKFEREFDYKNTERDKLLKKFKETIKNLKLFDLTKKK